MCVRFLSLQKIYGYKLHAETVVHGNRRAAATSARHRATLVPGHRCAAGFKEKKFPPIFLGHRKLPATVHGKRIFCAPNSAPPPPPLRRLNRAGAALTQCYRRTGGAPRRHDPVSISTLIRAWSATIPSWSALVSINSRACLNLLFSLF